MSSGIARVPHSTFLFEYKFRKSEGASREREPGAFVLSLNPLRKSSIASFPMESAVSFVDCVRRACWIRILSLNQGQTSNCQKLCVHEGTAARRFTDFKIMCR